MREIRLLVCYPPRPPGFLREGCTPHCQTATAAPRIRRNRIDTIISTPASGSFFAVGTHSVQVVVSDTSGNTDTCYFNITVNETEDPVAICPADTTVGTDPGL